MASSIAIVDTVDSKIQELKEYTDDRFSNLDFNTIMSKIDNHISRYINNDGCYMTMIPNSEHLKPILPVLELLYKDRGYYIELHGSVLYISWRKRSNIAIRIGQILSLIILPIVNLWSDVRYGAKSSK